MNREQYIIDGRLFVPDEDTLIVDMQPDLGNVFKFPPDIPGKTEKLYRTGKGTFYLLKTDEQGNRENAILDEQTAMEYINSHSEYIDVDGYIRAFGKPGRG